MNVNDQLAEALFQTIIGVNKLGKLDLDKLHDAEKAVLWEHLRQWIPKLQLYEAGITFTDQSYEEISQ